MIFAFAILLALDCQTVKGDRITGRDLAAANLAFAAVNVATDLGPAPLPGLRRVMRAADLTRLAARLGIAIEAPPGEACFERPIAALRPSPAARVKLGPPEVLRGDRVQVQVTAGAAQLGFEAEAASSGHVSEMIIVRNPESGSLFRARVEDKGKVSVKK